MFFTRNDQQVFMAEQQVRGHLEKLSLTIPAKNELIVDNEIADANWSIEFRCKTPLNFRLETKGEDLTSHGSFNRDYFKALAQTTLLKEKRDQGHWQLLLFDQKLCHWELTLKNNLIVSCRPNFILNFANERSSCQW